MNGKATVFDRGPDGKLKHCSTVYIWGPIRLELEEDYVMLNLWNVYLWRWRDWPWWRWGMEYYRNRGGW